MRAARYGDACDIHRGALFRARYGDLAGVRLALGRHMNNLLRARRRHLKAVALERIINLLGSFHLLPPCLLTPAVVFKARERKISTH